MNRLTRLADIIEVHGLDPTPWETPQDLADAVVGFLLAHAEEHGLDPSMPDDEVFQIQAPALAGFLRRHSLNPAPWPSHEELAEAIVAFMLSDEG